MMISFDEIDFSKSGTKEMMFLLMLSAYLQSVKGEVSPNNNVDWVRRKQFYKPNSKSLSRFG